MLQRRDFLKRLFGLSLTAGLPVSIASCVSVEAVRKAEVSTNPMGKRTILCQIDNPRLERDLKECAIILNCRINSEVPEAPDLIFIPHFVSVVDRNLLGADLWNVYVDCCNEDLINAPCILVDDLLHWPLPQKNSILQVSQNNEESGIIIKEHIKNFHLLNKIGFSQL